MATVRLQGLSKRFGRTQALDDVDLKCEPGQLLVLLGHSGAGKTTLLRLIAGLETVDRGEIDIGDVVVNELPCRDRGVSMAFESYALYPRRTVFENMAFSFQTAVQGAATAPDEVRRRVQHMAELLDIAPLVDRLPWQLSGGQRQRVALGRALVRDAAVHLLDEPIAHLDAKLRHQLRGELKHLQRDRGRTTIWSTPDQLEAMSVADRVAVFKEGVLVQEGNPRDLYRRPRNQFVALSFGDPAINLFDAGLEQRDGSLFLVGADWSLPVPAPRAEALQAHNVPQRVTLGLRPSDIAISRARQEASSFEGDVLMVEPLGSYSVIAAKLGKQECKVKTTADGDLEAGTRAWFTPDPAGFHLFHPETGEAL